MATFVVDSLAVRRLSLDIFFTASNLDYLNRNAFLC